MSQMRFLLSDVEMKNDINFVILSCYYDISVLRVYQIYLDINIGYNTAREQTIKGLRFMYLFKIFIIVSITLFLTLLSHKIPEASASKKSSVTQLPKGKVPLLDQFGKTDVKLEGRSAFYPLASPTDAFAARLFLIDHATTSLNVQYYIYKMDTLGKVFSAHILMAAQRGVKVRILMDDLSTTGKDERWQILASHPNIELRLFNPNRFRTYLRNLALLFNVNSLGKRMHNKSLIADGSAAIIGGRNIGDVYFASSAKTLFLDYDVVAIGKVVPEISEAFDLYWNSNKSVPSEDVLVKTDHDQLYLRHQGDLKKMIKTFNDTPKGKATLHSNFNRKIAKGDLTFIVAKQTDFYYDHPSKVGRDDQNKAIHISAQIKEELMEVKKELILVSPYFIPSDEMMQSLKEDRERGVNVTVMTNSLASTDVFLVYSAYQNDIKALLDMGVNLYELKPNSFKKLLRRTEWANPNSITLHTKMMIFDNARLAVGSANIDPRSDKLNTEILMIISSKKLAEAERKELDKVINLKNCYQLSWGAYPNDFREERPRYGPIWHTMEEGKEKTYYAPPHTGFWKRLGTDMLSILPIRGYL